LREYMKVAGKSLTHRGGSESHMDWEVLKINTYLQYII
jgi:hypothetical protein